jgi:hypothetical protein
VLEANGTHRVPEVVEANRLLTLAVQANGVTRPVQCP